MRSIEGPRGSPRVTLSFDAVRPPRPTAVSPNTMSDNRFPAAIDMQGFVDSWLEKRDGLLGYCSRLPGFGQFSAGVPLD